MKRTQFKKPTKEKLAQIQQKKLERYQISKKENKLNVGGKFQEPKRRKKKSTKQKKPNIPKLKKTLWKLVSEYIRSRDSYKCITCGKVGSGSGMHAGHFIPSSIGGALLRYYPRNIHAQCFMDNIHLGGYGAMYHLKMLEKYGQGQIDRIYELKNKTIKADGYFYSTLIELYKQKDELEIVRFIESYL